MPSLMSTSKAVRRFVSRRDGGMQLLKSWRINIEPASCYRQTRCLTGIVRSDWLPGDKLLPGGGHKDTASHFSLGSSFVQRRGFLGCGDGDEGNVLSKVYEEKIVLGYSPEQLYAVVAAVDLYEDFLPWCQRSDIVRRYPDGSFDAELEIGFKFLVESYISHVEMTKPKMIKASIGSVRLGYPDLSAVTLAHGLKQGLAVWGTLSGGSNSIILWKNLTTSSESNLFDHLINIWEFNPGPTPGTCTLHFFVDFKFQSPLYRQMASMFFKEVVTRMVRSFSDRCRLIYGPAAPVLENTIEQST